MSSLTARPALPPPPPRFAEGDRKAYYETSPGTIKQNRETLAAAKRENQELRETLARVAAERASLAHIKVRGEGQKPGPFPRPESKR